MRALILVLVFSAFGCGPPEPAPTATGPVFGHFEVTVESPELQKLDGAIRVKVGEALAYRVERISPTSVKFTVQGQPEGGDADIIVSNRSTEVKAGFVRYEAPKHKALARVVAFGASLTMGSQDANVSMRSQLHGPAAQFARATGAYLSLPLVKDGFMPGLNPDDFDKTTCTFKGSSIFGTIGDRVTATLIPKISDSEGQLRIYLARVDPEVEVRNVAIGGFRIGQAINGGGGALPTGLEHFIWNPHVEPSKLFEEPAEKMLDRVVALNPTLVMTTDLFGNDYNNVNLETDGIPDLTALTPMATFQQQLETVIDRLEPTGAEVFLATGPDPSVLPMYDQKVAKLRAAGFSESDATGWLEQMRAQVRAYNAELMKQVEGHPKFHVIDVYTMVNDIIANGLTVNGRVLRGKPFGGLLSYDSMHFSDTGYAVLANQYVKRVNEELGADVPLIDEAAVLASDPYSVDSLRAAGFQCPAF